MIILSILFVPLITLAFGYAIISMLISPRENFRERIKQLARFIIATSLDLFKIICVMIAGALALFGMYGLYKFALFMCELLRF
jgi:hypothetical protein